MTCAVIAVFAGLPGDELGQQHLLIYLPLPWVDGPDFSYFETGPLAATLGH